MALRFSGHDTFHCKQQWLLKGYQLIENHNHNAFNNTEEAIKHLGVGRNMVSSVKYWLESFHITHNNELTRFANYIFGEDGVDIYLEDEGTLWLLQFYLCHTNYASIYNLLFTKYFIDKATYEFDEQSAIQYLNKYSEESEGKQVSKKTLSNDFKAFIRSYIPTKREVKTIEDDFNTPLLELNLIEKADEHNNYVINKTTRHIPINVFAYCILKLSEEKDAKTLSLKYLQGTIGNYFCLTVDSLVDHLLLLNQFNNLFIYSDTAGMPQISILKDDCATWSRTLLNKHYEI